MLNLCDKRKLCLLTHTAYAVPGFHEEHNFSILYNAKHLPTNDMNRKYTISNNLSQKNC